MRGLSAFGKCCQICFFFQGSLSQLVGAQQLQGFVSNPPISILGFPCSSPAVVLPLNRVWTGCTHQTPELLAPSQRHCLAFSDSMADPFCSSRSKARLALALRSEPALEPVLCGAAPAPWPVISWQCSLMGQGCRVPVMLLRIKGSICTQSRPIFFLSCSSLFAPARRDSLM